MEFSIKSVTPGQTKNGCAVVGVYESRKLSAAGAALDRSAKGYLANVVKRDMEGKAGTTLLLRDVPNIACDRVLLVGLGPKDGLREKQYREAVHGAVRALVNTSAGEVEMHLATLEVPGHDAAWCITQAVLTAHDALYRFEHIPMLADMANVNRHVEDDDLDAARRAAESLDEITVGATCIPDATMPPSALDVGAEATAFEAA